MEKLYPATKFKDAFHVVTLAEDSNTFLLSIPHDEVNKQGYTITFHPHNTPEVRGYSYYIVHTIPGPASLCICNTAR